MSDFPVFTDQRSDCLGPIWYEWGMTALAAAAVPVLPHGRVLPDGQPPTDDQGDLPSNPVPFNESLAQAVARAGSGMTNSALANRAGISTRTLRDILDPTTTRRFGRTTLDKLDGPLGWPTGRAWQMYRRRACWRRQTAVTTTADVDPARRWRRSAIGCGSMRVIAAVGERVDRRRAGVEPRTTGHGC